MARVTEKNLKRIIKEEIADLLEQDGRDAFGNYNNYVLNLPEDPRPVKWTSNQQKSRGMTGLRLVKKAMEFVAEVDPQWADIVQNVNIDVDGAGCGGGILHKIIEWFTDATTRGAAGYASPPGGLWARILSEIPILGPWFERQDNQNAYLGGDIVICPAALKDLRRGGFWISKLEAKHFTIDGPDVFFPGWVYDLSHMLAIASTLVHEMGHVRQFRDGTIPMFIDLFLREEEEVDLARLAAGYETQANKYAAQWFKKLEKSSLWASIYKKLADLDPGLASKFRRKIRYGYLGGWTGDDRMTNTIPKNPRTLHGVADEYKGRFRKSRWPVDDFGKRIGPGSLTDIPIQNFTRADLDREWAAREKGYWSTKGARATNCKEIWARCGPEEGWASKPVVETRNGVVSGKCADPHLDARLWAFHGWQVSSPYRHLSWGPVPLPGQTPTFQSRNSALVPQMEATVDSYNEHMYTCSSKWVATKKREFYEYWAAREAIVDPEVTWGNIKRKHDKAVAQGKRGQQLVSQGYPSKAVERYHKKKEAECKEQGVWDRPYADGVYNRRTGVCEPKPAPKSK